MATFARVVDPAVTLGGKPGGEMTEFRRRVLADSERTYGGVILYEAAQSMERHRRSFSKIS